MSIGSNGYQIKSGSNKKISSQTATFFMSVVLINLLNSK